MLSAFYDLTTLASTADSDFTSFGDLPSINNQGVVAFVGNTDSGNGIWTASSPDDLTNVTAAFTANNDGRTYGRGVAINDSGQIVARDQNGTEFYVRQWNANQPNQNTVLFAHPAIGTNSPDSQFASAQTFTATDNAGAAAFVLYDSLTADRNLVEESGNNIGDGTYTSIAQFDAIGSTVSPRPQMTSAGQVLYLSQTGQLVLATPGGASQIIAGPSTGYVSIGSNAGISQDGRVIVFTAYHGYGQSLWAALQLGSSYQIIPLAGGSPDVDSFASFDTNSDIAVNSTWDTNRSVTIAFKGTSALGPGIYSVQLSIFGQHASDANPVQPTSYAENAGGYYESGIKPVALEGDFLSPGVKITNVQLGQGINDLERGQIAFWAQTVDINHNNAVNQEIILAEPEQVVWLNFNPPPTPPIGTTQANLNLLTNLGITKWGWDGPMSDALKDANVTYNAATVQNDVVNEVQQMYFDAGANVVVLGRTTDLPPAYVSEPIYGTSARAGAYQTVYVGEGTPNGSKWLGLASAPPAAAGVVDFYDQIPDDTAVVLVNNILTDGAYSGTPPSALSEDQVVNGIATIVAHESGHNFGLFHLSEADKDDNLLTHEVMINGTLPGSFNSPAEFGDVAYPVYEYNDELQGVTENSAQRLQYTTGALSADPPDPAGDLPEPELLQVDDNGSFRANIGFQAANSVTVKDLVVGIQSSVVETMPVFQDLGGGDLATLLNNANISVSPDDSLIVIGSTDGKTPDIIAVAKGQEGAQNSFSATDLGLITDSALEAPVSGSGAGLHFYQLTSSGSKDLGTAGINLSPLSATAVVTLTASNPSPLAGQAITFTARVASGGAAPTGSVRFEVDGSDVGSALNLVNGAATSGSTTLTPGSHAITAVYSGDAANARTSGFFTLSAAALSPTVGLSAGNSTPIAGQAFTVMALVTPPAPGNGTPTGSVQFEVDGADVGAAVALAGGAATSAGITLTAGSHTITALYLGDATYTGGLASLTVAAVVPTATVQVTATSPLTIAGQQLTFTAAVTPSVSGAPTPTGTVQFEVDGSDLGAAVALVNGAATSGSVTLTVGSHTVTAVYSGDPTYAGGPGSLTLTAIAPGTLAVGSLDPTYGSGGVEPVGTRGQATEAFALDAEGRTVTAGQTELGNFLLSRYTADGQPDLSFGNLGVSPYQPANQGADEIAFEPDGKIVVMQGGGQLTRFFSNGSLDTTFGTNGVVQPPSITSNGNAEIFYAGGIEGGDGLGVASLPDGRVLFAGLVYHGGLVYDGYALVMYLPDGQLDTSFNGSGTLLVNSPSGIVQALAVTDNEILVMTSSGSDPDDIAVTAYHFDGTLVSGFGAGGVLTPTLVAARGGFDSPAMAIQPDGKILLGYLSTPQSLFSKTEILLRYNSDGTPNATFGTEGTAIVTEGTGDYEDGTYITGATFAFEPTGKIVLSATLGIVSGGDERGLPEPILARLNSDGSVDTSFGTDGMDQITLPAYPGAVFGQVAVDPAGRIVVDTEVNSQDVLTGIVGDPVVAFGDASSVSTSSGMATAVYSVSETAGSAAITLTRGGDLSQPLSVPFSTDDSGGHGGVNYTPVKTTVTFAAGSATATVVIPILNDPRSSPAVDIPLRLGTPTGGAVLGSVSVGDLHIVPIEGIAIAPAQIPSVMQGGAGSSFTVVLQSVPTANVTVPLNISTTSPAGMLSTTTLTFTPANALVPQTVTVSAASGAASSPALATVSSGPATSADPKYNGLAGGTASVEIYPSGTASPGAIQFSAANYTVNEDASTATITLVRLGGSQGTVSVHFATLDGSPFSSGKYTPLSGTISFSPGVTSRQFLIALLNPGRNLEGDQTVDLTLSNPGGGATLGVFPTATLTLHDTGQIGSGDLDPAFGADGVAILPFDNTVSSAGPEVIALQPDEKIVAVSSGTPVAVWRTDARGQPDTSFGQQGEAFVPFPNFGSVVGVVIDPDGKIVVAGNASGKIALFRLNSNGTLDTTFGTDGLVTVSVSPGSDTADALAVESDGSILVGAAIGNASGGSSAGLVHFNSDGSLDIGFGSGGVLSFPSVGTSLDSILQQPDGEWLLLGGGGGASIDTGAPSGFVLRLNPDFSFDTTFGSQGVASFGYGEFYYSLALQPDGKILIAGGEGPNAGGASTIGRLNADGSLDTTFGQDGSVAAGFSSGISAFTSVFVQPDGRIVGAGSADGYDTAVRYLPDGQLDPSFASGGKLQFSLSADHLDTTGTAVTLPDGDIVMTIESDGLPLLAAVLPETPAPATAPNQHPGQLVLATPTASVIAGNTAYFTVDRFGGSDGIVTVAYTTQDDTAVAGTDYSATSGTLTFAPGVTWQILSIPTLFDSNASGSLSLDLVLQAPTGGATLGATDIAALTITPAPPPPAPTTLTVTPVAGTYGITATFAATLTVGGSPLAGEPVTFTVTVGGKITTVGTAMTDADGDASLSGTNVATLPPGTYPGAVTVVFAGGAGGAASTGSGDVSIAQATPTVTWVMPADITQGQALGAEQLDATASVSGTFVYSPAAGTVLPAGLGQTLTAVFTPSDATDYKSVNKSTTLNVLSPTAPPTVTGVSPNKGPTTGGTLMTITGTNLAGATAVNFGPVQITSFISDTASQIILSSPAGTGSVDVTVRTAAGLSVTSSADKFLYFVTQAVPSTISAVSGGGTIGGTATLACTLTASSAPLAGKAVVFILSEGGTVRNVGTATTNANGIATVTGVSLAGIGAGIYSGAVSASFAGDSTYAASTASGTLVVSATALPAVTAVSPATGATTGGTLVTITGTNLAGATAVDFGPMQITSFISDTASQIILSSPAGTGAVPVTVMTASGTSAISSAGFFSYFLSQVVPTNISAVSGGGTVGGTATLTSTLTAGSVPLAGKTVIFTLSEGGTDRTVGTATTNANGIATLTGASVAGIGAGNYSGAVSASFAGDSTYSASSGSGALVVSAPTPLIITSEQALFRRKTNKKGKPIGKPVLSGFLFDFSQALSASSATNNANYQVDSVTTKRVKRQTRRILHPITSFSVAYSAANDSATLTFAGKQTFMKGGQITLLGGSESGITGVSGAELAGTKVFAISPRGQSIVAQ